jgi:hypothetical protein
MSLDGVVVTTQTTIELINEEKKGKKFPETLRGFTSSLAHEKLYVVIRRSKESSDKNVEFSVEARNAN